MQEVTAIIAIVQDAGFIGLLIILSIPKLRGFVFNGSLQSQQPQIDELKEHAKVANEEMGKMDNRMEKIEGHVADIKSDVSFIRGKISK